MYPAMIVGSAGISSRFGKNKTEKNRNAAIGAGAGLLGAAGLDFQIDNMIEGLRKSHLEEYQRVEHPKMVTQMAILNDRYTKAIKKKERSLDKTIRDKTFINRRETANLPKKVRKLARDTHDSQMRIMKEGVLTNMKQQRIKDMEAIREKFNAFNVNESDAFKKAVKGLRLSRVAIPAAVGTIGGGLLLRDYLKGKRK